MEKLKKGTFGTKMLRLYTHLKGIGFFPKFIFKRLLAQFFSLYAITWLLHEPFEDEFREFHGKLETN